MSLLSRPQFSLLGWADGRAIVFKNNSGIAATGRHLPIELSAANFDFTKAESDGTDLRFTDENGNLLDFVRRFHDAAGKTALYHVKMPVCAAGATLTLFLFFGNPDASDASDFNATCSKKTADSDTIALWHCDDGSGTSAANAVGGGPSLSLNGGATWEADPFFTSGNSIKLDGTDDYLSAAAVFASGFPPEGTIRMNFAATALWSTASGAAKRLFHLFIPSGGDNRIDCFFDNTTGKIKISFTRTPDSVTVASLATSWAAGYFHTLVLAWDDVWVYLYIDGQLQDKAATIIPAGSGAVTFEAGTLTSPADGTHSSFADETVDEIMISTRPMHPDEAVADTYITKLIPTHQRDKWGAGVAVTGVGDFNGNEMGVVKNDDGTFSYFCPGYAPGHPEGEIVNRYVSSSPAGPWSADSNNPLIGWGTGGAGSTESAARISRPFKIKGIWYLLASNITGTADIILYRLGSSLTSAPLSGITRLGIAIPHDAVAHMTTAQNSEVFPELVNGVYHCMFDASFSDISGNFRPGHATFTHPETLPWACSRGSSSLAVLPDTPPLSWGMGPSVQKDENGVIHVWTHFTDYPGRNSLSTSPNTFLPTPMAHHTTEDFVTFTPSAQQPVLGIEKSWIVQPDQAADVCLLGNIDGKCYFFVSYTNNDIPDWQSVLYTFNGTLAELTAASAAVIGSPFSIPVLNPEEPIFNAAGFLFKEVAIAFHRLRADFGDGYGASSLIGSSQGTRRWSLTIDVIPDSTDQAPAIEGDTRAAYLWNFYCERKSSTNHEVFWFRDPRDGLYRLAEFAEDELTFQILCAKVYSAGLQIRQRRLRGVASPVSIS